MSSEPTDTGAGIAWGAIVLVLVIVATAVVIGAVVYDNTAAAPSVTVHTLTPASTP